MYATLNAVTPEQIAKFITKGHSRVAGTKNDPYATSADQNLKLSIKKDAKQIHRWWATQVTTYGENTKQARRALRSIKSIRRGPAAFKA